MHVPRKGPCAQRVRFASCPPPPPGATKRGAPFHRDRPLAAGARSVRPFGAAGKAVLDNSSVPQVLPSGTHLLFFFGSGDAAIKGVTMRPLVKRGRPGNAFVCKVLPETYPQGAERAPKLTTHCPQSIQMLLPEPRFGPNAANSNRFGPCLGRCWPTPVKTWPISATVGGFGPHNVAGLGKP